MPLAIRCELSGEIIQDAVVYRGFFYDRSAVLQAIEHGLLKEIIEREDLLPEQLLNGLLTFARAQDQLSYEDLDAVYSTLIELEFPLEAARLCLRDGHTYSEEEIAQLFRADRPLSPSNRYPISQSDFIRSPIFDLLRSQLPRAGSRISLEETFKDFRFTHPALTTEKPLHNKSRLLLMVAFYTDFLGLMLSGYISHRSESISEFALLAAISLLNAEQFSRAAWHVLPNTTSSARRLAPALVSLLCAMTLTATRELYYPTDSLRQALNFHLFWSPLRFLNEALFALAAMLHGDNGACSSGDLAQHTQNQRRLLQIEQSGGWPYLSKLHKAFYKLNFFVPSIFETCLILFNFYVFYDIERHGQSSARMVVAMFAAMFPFAIRMLNGSCYLNTPNVLMESVLEAYLERTLSINDYLTEIVAASFLSLLTVSFAELDNIIASSLLALLAFPLFFCLQCRSPADLTTQSPPLSGLHYRDGRPSFWQRHSHDSVRFDREEDLRPHTP